MKLIKKCISGGLSLLRKYRNDLRYKRFMKAVEILSPYVNVDLTKDGVMTADRGKIVWQLWLQGEDKAPPVVKRCFESVKRHLPDGYRLIVLDEKSLKDWVEIPEYLEQRYKLGQCLAANYADYIRTCLLVKYGGIWIDATVYLSGDLPRDIVESDIFVFKEHLWCCCNTAPDDDFFLYLAANHYDSALYGSNWFIVAKPERIVLRVIKKAFEDYWKSKDYQCDYFMFHILFTLAVIRRRDCRMEFESMPNYPNDIPHLLQTGFKAKYSEEAYEALMRVTHVHKLTYRHGKVVKNSMLEHFLQMA